MKNQRTPTVFRAGTLTASFIGFTVSFTCPTENETVTAELRTIHHTGSGTYIDILNPLWPDHGGDQLLEYELTHDALVMVTL